MDKIQRKIRSDMALRGWSWIWVFDAEGEHPPFAYSIGFTQTFNHPEIVVAGLDEETSWSVLDSVQSLISVGREFVSGDQSFDVLEQVGVEFRAISNVLKISNLSQAAVYYGQSKFSALQLIWPDRDGNLPGKGDLHSALADRQRLHQ